MATTISGAATPKEQPQIVKIFKDYVELALSTGQKKTVTLVDFKHALDKSLNVQTLSETTLLPSNCYLMSKGLDAMTIGCYYLGEVREVKFINESKEHKFKIPFPNIIITNKLTKTINKWGVQSTRFFCTHKNVGQLPLTPIEQVNRSENIWALPFPNMYGDGRMCYGNNTMPSGFVDNNFRALDWYFQILFTAPYNADLHLPEIAKRPYTWFTELSKLAKFPYAQLAEYKETNIVADRTRPEQREGFNPTTILTAVPPGPGIVVPPVGAERPVALTPTAAGTTGPAVVPNVTVNNGPTITFTIPTAQGDMQVRPPATR